MIAWQQGDCVDRRLSAKGDIEDKYIVDKRRSLKNPYLATFCFGHCLDPGVTANSGRLAHPSMLEDRLSGMEMHALSLLLRGQANPN
jgi:hypothetical protein